MSVNLVVCMYMCVSLETDWQPRSSLSPNVCWDTLQPYVTLNRLSSLENGWMDVNVPLLHLHLLLSSIKPGRRSQPGKDTRLTSSDACIKAQYTCSTVLFSFTVVAI